MKLYHLSFDLEPPLSRTFQPRVPKYKIYGENQTVPRICFSSSLIGCINAIPEANMFLDPAWNSGGLRTQAVLYTMDSADLLPDKFLDSQELYERRLVPDALVNQECWCLEPVWMSGEIVDIEMGIDCRNETLFCAPERDRGLIYSVIDRICDDYAKEHRYELDKLSLLYVMNWQAYSAAVSQNKVWNLQDEFFALSKTGVIDSVDVYTHVRVDGITHCVDEILYFNKYRSDRPSLDEMIGYASGRVSSSFSHNKTIEKETAPEL